MEDDTKNILKTHEDPLVIEANIDPNSKVTKIIFDTGISSDILYISAFSRLSGKIVDLVIAREPIYGFISTIARFDCNDNWLKTIYRFKETTGKPNYVVRGGHLGLSFSVIFWHTSIYTWILSNLILVSSMHVIPC